MRIFFLYFIGLWYLLCFMSSTGEVGTIFTCMILVECLWLHPRDTWNMLTLIRGEGAFKYGPFFNDLRFRTLEKISAWLTWFLNFTWKLLPSSVSKPIQRPRCKEDLFPEKVRVSSEFLLFGGQKDHLKKLLPSYSYCLSPEVGRACFYGTNWSVLWKQLQ